MNHLTNPDFGEGHFHQDNIPELVVPNGWQLYYIDGDTFPGCGNPPAYRPESVVWNIEDAPEHERKVFFLRGNYCLKVFKAHAPVYFALTQAASGLTSGERYRFAAHVYPDIVMGYRGGQKIRPGDIWHAEARVGWSAPATSWPRGDDGDVNWSTWFNVNNQNFQFGAYNEIGQEFVAPDNGQVRVWLECKAKWGNAENNWFMDAFALTEVEHGESPSKARSQQPRGAPRVQFERTFILLPRDLAPAMVVAAMRMAYDSYTTVGFSPDEAGIGDLDTRRVVCVNPGQIAGGLSQAWYDQHYPGVEFVPVLAQNAQELAQILSRLLSG